jgi:predicted dehydrogenase
VLADDLIDTIVVATRHDSHAGLVVKALAAGKHVFVEKPLALTMEEIEAIDEACCAARGGGRTPLVMIGFNRRFAPHTLRMKALLEGQCLPKAMVMTVNAGAVPADHWTQDADIGGGRIIGEACHFIDLLRHLAGSPITTHYMQPMASQTGDSATIILGFADGSTGAIHYFANGNKALPKERLEIFTAGKVLQLDNFRALTGHGWERFSRMRLWRQDKGQRACAAAFIEAIRSGGGAPIAYDEIIEVSRVTLALGASSRGAAESPRP